jgi:hypothetical protein
MMRVAQVLILRNQSFGNYNGIDQSGVYYAIQDFLFYFGISSNLGHGNGPD